MKEVKREKEIQRRAAAYITALALCIVYLWMPVGIKTAKAVTSASGEWEYIENGDGTIMISKYNGTSNYLTIPEIIDDKSVTIIGNRAFYQNNYLNSVIISSSITKIEEEAFSGCNNLEAVMLPGSISDIGKTAFGSCSSLQSISIPNSVTNIEDCAFMMCSSLKNITLSNNLTRISSLLFCGCSSLERVVVPDSVISVEDDAFSACENLTYIKLPDSLESIGTNAFRGCSSLNDIEISDGVIDIGEGAFDDCSDTLVIKTVSGSYTETYANEHGIAVQLTDISVPVLRPTPIPVTPEPIVPDNTDDVIPDNPLPPSMEPEIPTESPTPTPMPSSTPTSSPTPTPSPTPTSVPTITPSTPTPSTPTPAVTPTPLPVITVPPVSEPTPTSGFSDDYTGKRSQAIHAKSVTKEYGSRLFNLGANSDSYGELIYSSSNNKVVTVDTFGWATIKGYGKSVITIKAPETADYKKATKKITVTIVPKKVTAKALKSPSAKKAVYSWKKDKTVSGYHIYVSIKKDFRSNTFERVVKSKTSLSVRGLKSGKIYYFKVRAYKKVGKNKYYGKWSKVKKVKIK